MKKATTKELGDLHGHLTKYFKNLLTSGKELNGGELNSIAAFLKTNHVSVDIVKDDSMQDIMAGFKDMTTEVDLDKYGL